MNIRPKTAALLGFARKSGALILGESALEQGIRNRRIQLVILAEDTLPKKRKALGRWCQSLKVPFVILGTKEAFGRIFNIRPQGFAGVTDLQMAQAILSDNQTIGGD
jgi:ribosomal protein L7Ae-like RNA K-turn-binding protein